MGRTRPRKSRTAKSRTTLNDSASPAQHTAHKRKSGADFQTTHQWRIELLWALGVGLIALLVFVFTLAPTVTAEDSGELIAAAWHFGVPHPPGYPLWTIFCGAFVHVFSVGSVAMRANLFSALCSAAAAGALFASVRQIDVKPLAAAGAALAVIWSRWSWSQSVITEVYALNSLLTALLLWCAMRWYCTRRTGPLLAASVVMGLGMCDHHIIALSGVAVVAWMLIVDWRLGVRWRLVLGCIGLFLVSLLPYLYLPIRADADPPINWGDPSTMSRFKDHVTRQQYGAIGPTKSVDSRSFSRIIGQTKYVAQSVIDDLTWPMALIAVGGLAVLAGRDRKLLLLAVLWVIATGVLFVLLANFDLDRTSRWAMRVFLIPVSLGMIIPISSALNTLLTWIHGHFKSPEIVRGLCIAMAAAAPASVIATHWRQCDYSNYWYAYDHADNFLTCMMPNAIIFPSGDHSTFPLIYLQLVEGKRADVLIADMYGYLSPKLYKDQPAGSTASPHAWFIKHARRPVYFAVKSAPPVANARFVTAGMLYHLLPNHMTFDGNDLLGRCNYRNRQSPTVIDLGASHINADYAFFSGLRALEHGDLAAALKHFEEAVSCGWGIKELLNNVGSALAEHSHAEQALGYFEQAAQLDRHYVMPRWNLFQIAQNSGEWSDARRKLEDILSVESQNTRALNAMGYLLRDQFRDSQGAQSRWQESLEINPNQPTIAEQIAKAKLTGD